MAGAYDAAITDSLNRPLFRCDICGQPLTQRDFDAMGLRIPDPGETAADYMYEELIDGIAHADCAGVAAHAS